MSRKSATIKLDDKEITIKEMRVKDVIAFFNEVQETNNSIPALIEAAKKLMPAFIDVDADYLLELAPSEIKGIWEKFKEVNTDFFDVLKGLGIMDLLDKIKTDMVGNLSHLSAPSLPQVTE
jgi:hypothetical protein